MKVPISLDTEIHELATHLPEFWLYGRQVGSYYFVNTLRVFEQPMVLARWVATMPFGLEVCSDQSCYTRLFCVTGRPGPL